MTTATISQTEQLELTLANRNTGQGGRSQSRHSAAQRAHWWFSQMRRAVECAAEWSNSTQRAGAPANAGTTGLSADSELRPSLP